MSATKKWHRRDILGGPKGQVAVIWKETDDGRTYRIEKLDGTLLESGKASNNEMDALGVAKGIDGGAAFTDMAMKAVMSYTGDPKDCP